MFSFVNPFSKVRKSVPHDNFQELFFCSVEWKIAIITLYG